MVCVNVCSASNFRRAIVMPNLKPPVTSTAAAVIYRNFIIKALPSGSSFDPLMTLYLTDKTQPDEIKRASKWLQVVRCIFIVMRLLSLCIYMCSF